MPPKKFRLRAELIETLIEHNGGCIATDRITVDGCPVGYMYREPPSDDADTGWRFMAGDESQEYMDDPGNHGVYAVNTIANYDRDIITLVDEPIGSAFARESDTDRFEPVESPVDPDDCLHPEFPVVTGDYPLSDRWQISLPLKFNRRLEDGSLILWRPGITIYLIAWGNDDGESIGVRLNDLKSGISREAFEPKLGQSGVTQQFSYRLIEDGVQAIYGFAVADDGHLQVSIYFDDEADVDLAREIFASLNVRS